MENKRLVIIKERTIDNTKDFTGKLLIFTKSCIVKESINATVIVARENLEIKGDINLSSSMHVLGNLKAGEINARSVEVDGRTYVKSMRAPGGFKGKGKIVIEKGGHSGAVDAIARYQFNVHNVELPQEVIAAFPEDYFKC